MAQDDASLAKIIITAGVTVVIPTYEEVENIPHILSRLDAMRKEHHIDLEVIFVDDDSRDGSVEAVKAAGFDWARIIVRTEDRGLSPAVIEGFRQARHPILVCMDCDLSHPVERIPDMVLALSSGQQMVIGSRYVPGGSTDDNWGFWRWLNSRIATILARPLTSVKDPMSGFFTLRKSDLDQASGLNPVGYKIALEIITKCAFENVGEVPIAFADRVHGESKLTIYEQLKFIQHLRRLYLHKFSEAMHLAQFLFVGGLGLIVNLFFLTLANLVGFAPTFAIVIGIATSVTFNFFMNRRFSFSYAKEGRILPQYLSFLTASAVGMFVNFTVALLLFPRFVAAELPFALQLASMAGVVCGLTFNFIGSRYFAFRKRHIR